MDAAISILKKNNVPGMDLNKFLKRFKGKKVLGQGGQGTAYCVLDMRNGGSERVLKKMSLVRIKPDDLERKITEGIQEYNFMKLKKINCHSNLVCMYELFYTVKRSENKVHMWILMDRLHDNIYNAAAMNSRDKESTSVKTIITWMTDIARALATLHTHGIVHRDIKHENILQDATGNHVFLSDYGLICDLSESDKACHGAGTKHYRSPEDMTYNTTTLASDIYSLGVVFYELITGYYLISSDTWERRIYHGKTDKDIFSAFGEDIQLGFRRVFPMTKHRDVGLLIQRMLSLDPQRRPTAEQTVLQLRELQKKYPP